MKNRKLNIGLFVTIIGTVGTYLTFVTPELRKCVGLDSSDPCPISNPFSKDDSPLKIEEDEIPVSSWKEVPGTNMYEGGDKVNAYIDKDMIRRNSELVIFNLISDGDQYYRIEGDCYKLRWKQIRTGHFESKEKIYFTEKIEDWKTQINRNQAIILKHVCQISQK